MSISGSDGGGEGLLSAARFALRVVACGNALSLALKSNLGRSFSSFPAWAEYLIADSVGKFRDFLKSDGGGEGLLSAARFALRVVACGNALSLALESNLGRSFSSFPAWAEYLIADSLGSSGTFESDGGGEGLLSAARFASTGRCLRQRSLADARVEPGRSFSSFPAWAEYLIMDL